MTSFTVIFSPDPNAGGVSVPAMPGALTWGITREEAVRNIQEVMQAWVEIAHEDGYAPHDETPTSIASEVVSIIKHRDAEGWERTIETVVVELPVLLPS